MEFLKKLTSTYKSDNPDVNGKDITSITKFNRPTDILSNKYILKGGKEMKRFIFIQLISLILVSVLCMSEAMAVGLGLYFNFGNGSTDGDVEAQFEDNWDDYTFEYSYEGDTKHFGWGFVLDTAVAKNKVFNYRLNIGYEKFSDEWQDIDKIEALEDYDWKMNMEGIVLDNIFGFGVLRTKSVRMWLGPQVRLAYFTGKIEVDGEEDEDFDNKLFGIGIGPVIGININAGNAVTPAFTFGCLYTHYSGKGTYHSGYDEFEQDYSINEMTYFINFSLLFRVNDVF